jgi:hypothetical protein
VPETWRLFHRHASSQWSDRGYLARQGKPASSELVDPEALRRELARTPPLIRCLSAVGPYPQSPARGRERKGSLDFAAPRQSPPPKPTRGQAEKANSRCQAVWVKWLFRFTA